MEMIGKVKPLNWERNRRWKENAVIAAFALIAATPAVLILWSLWRIRLDIWYIITDHINL